MAEPDFRPHKHLCVAGVRAIRDLDELVVEAGRPAVTQAYRALAAEPVGGDFEAQVNGLEALRLLLADEPATRQLGRLRERVDRAVVYFTDLRRIYGTRAAAADDLCSGARPGGEK